MKFWNRLNMIHLSGNLTYVKIVTDIFPLPQLQIFVYIYGEKRERIHEIKVNLRHVASPSSTWWIFFRAALYRARVPVLLRHCLAFRNSVLQCNTELCIRTKLQRPPVGSLFLDEHILGLYFELFVFPFPWMLWSSLLEQNCFYVSFPFHVHFWLSLQ